MKNYTFIIMAVAVLSVACSPSGSRSTITGNISGAEGKTVFLERFINNQQVRTDSATIQADGSFSLTPNPPLELNFYRLLFDNEHYTVLITDSTESPEISAAFDNMKSGPEVSGSTHTEKLVGLYSQLSGFQQKMSDMRTRIQSSANEAESAQLKTDFTNLQKERIDFCKKWLESESASPAALAAVSELDLRSELPVYKKVIESLAPVFSHSMYYKDVAMRVANQEKAASMPQNNEANSAATMEEIQRKLRENANQSYDTQDVPGSVGPGTRAPEIADKSPDGKIYKLSDLKGKVVLIDFWASWCGPCRKENPYVVAAYQKFHKKGFEVFSVSLDNNAERWKQAIQQDALPWPYHVSDLKGWQSSHAAKYGVRSIPAPFLVGKDGIVIATGSDVRGPGLEAELENIFGY